MSSSGALADVVEASSCSGSARLSYDTSCISNKEYLLSVADGQDACSSTAQIGFTVGQLILPNGDKYSGTLSGNMPEVSGKYTWSDGCAA